MLGCRISEPGCEENHFVVTVGEDNDVRVHNIKEGPRNIQETKTHEIETEMWYFTTIVQGVSGCFRCVIFRFLDFLACRFSV